MADQIKKGSLGDILSASQIISEADISLALDEQKRTGARFGEALVNLGIVTQEDIDWVVKKVSQLRIFNDPEGVMNLSIQDVIGDLIVVSQFTLHASTKKGNRPSYIYAAKPETAIPLYEQFIKQLLSKYESRGN